MAPGNSAKILPISVIDPSISNALIEYRVSNARMSVCEGGGDMKSNFAKFCTPSLLRVSTVDAMSLRRISGVVCAYSNVRREH